MNSTYIRINTHTDTHMCVKETHRHMCTETLVKETDNFQKKIEEKKNCTI